MEYAIKRELKVIIFEQLLLIVSLELAETSDEIVFEGESTRLICADFEFEVKFKKKKVRFVLIGDDN